MSNIPTYFLVISAVVCLSLFWLHGRAFQQGFNRRWVMDIALVSLIFGFIGARLTHVVYEYPEIYWQSPWRIFDLGRGGYVYYGGLVIGFLAGWLFIKQRKLGSPYHYMDLVTPVLSFGYAMGRIACFLAGCCYGPATDLPWAYLIKDEHGQLIPRHPTPLYSTIIELGVLLFILLLEKNRKKIKLLDLKKPGQIFFLWLFLHSLSRFILEFWRDDFRGPSFLFFFSAWVSLLLMVLALVFFKKRAH